jgi:hypothetical protein
VIGVVGHVDALLAFPVTVIDGRSTVHDDFLHTESTDCGVHFVKIILDTIAANDKACTDIGKAVQDDFDKMDPAVSGFSVKEIVMDCGPTINNCDGKSQECVNMANHPNHPDYRRPNSGTVHKISALLLAFIFAYMM